jgi:hypothetical protein
VLPEKSSSQDSSLGERQHAIFTYRLPATPPSDAMASKVWTRGSTLDADTTDQQISRAVHDDARRGSEIEIQISRAGMTSCADRR